MTFKKQAENVERTLMSLLNSRFMRVSWSSVQSQDDFEQAETSSWAGSAYSKHQPALPNCTFQSARLKQRSLKYDLEFGPN